MVTSLRERRFPVLVELAKSVEHLKKGLGPVIRQQRNAVEARQTKKLTAVPLPPLETLNVSNVGEHI